LGLAPGKLAALGNSQIIAAGRVTESPAISSPRSALFGLLMRQQIPQSGMLAPGVASQADSEALTGKSPASLLAGATPGEPRFTGSSKTPSRLAQESTPGSAERPRDDSGFPPPTHPQLPGDPSRGMPAEGPSSLGAQSAPAREISSSPIAAQPVDAEGGAEATQISSAGSEPWPPAGTAIAPAIGRFSPVRAEERVETDEKASPPARDRKTESTGKQHSPQTGPASSGAITTGGPPEAALSPATSSPTLQCGPTATDSGDSVPAARFVVETLSTRRSDHGLQPSGSGLPSTRPQSSSRSDSSPAASLSTHAGPSAGTREGAEGHTAKHDASALPSGAVQQGMSEVVRPAAAIQEGQHASPAVGSTSAPGAGNPAVHPTQPPDLTGSGGPFHSFARASEAELHPSAAFERMDAAPPVRLLESSPHKLDVGIRDAGLGWLEIRTHTVAGQVAATLATGNREAHAAIAAELPAMRDSLMTQHVSLHSLSAERYTGSSAGGGSPAGSSDARNPVHPSVTKAKANASPAQSESEAETLSYISIRV
jgi:hypothetical protein